MEPLFSLFVIPTLAGYVFLTKTNLHKVKTDGISSSLLFVESLIYGIFLLYISYIFLSLSFGHGLFVMEDYFLSVYLGGEFEVVDFFKKGWEVIKWPFDAEIKIEKSHFSQESFFALLVAFLYSYIFEMEFIKESAWYNRKVMTFRDKTKSELERMLYFAMNTFTPIQVTLKNRKVYVGLLQEMPEESRHSVKKDGQYMQILPLKSGYRDGSTLEISEDMTDYSFMVDLYVQHRLNGYKEKQVSHSHQDDEVNPVTLENSLKYGIFIDFSEVLSIGLWDGAIFKKFKNGQLSSVKEK